MASLVDFEKPLLLVFYAAISLAERTFMEGLASKNNPAAAAGQ
jgi:hypothetical protein